MMRKELNLNNLTSQLTTLIDVKVYGPYYNHPKFYKWKEERYICGSCLLEIDEMIHVCEQIQPRIFHGQIVQLNGPHYKHPKFYDWNSVTYVCSKCKQDNFFVNHNCHITSRFHDKKRKIKLPR